MKKNLITLIIVGSIVVEIYFVIGLFSNTPPSPTVTFEEKQVEVAQGSYCWDGFINSGCVDMISPPEIIKHHKLKPVIVSPESELKIEFKRVPKEKGIYVYDVSARWKKGDSSFAFVIKVK